VICGLAIRATYINLKIEMKKSPICSASIGVQLASTASPSPKAPCAIFAATLILALCAGAALGAGACGLVGVVVARFPRTWMGLFTTDGAVTEFGASYLVRVGPAYAFLGLGLALYFVAQGRGRVVRPLLATLTRLLVSGALGAVAMGVLGWGIDVLFGLMACGLALYGLVMVVVMRRELGLVKVTTHEWRNHPSFQPPAVGNDLMAKETA